MENGRHLLKPLVEPASNYRYLIFLRIKSTKINWYPKDMEQNSCISQSENGWPDDKLCIK